MTRLIDADALKKAFDFDDDVELECAVVQYGIDHAPTVAPVKHGHWINSGYACGETDWECSVCHCHEWRTGETEYCMRCGATMDEVTE